jgi:esterase/lipase superfamily enzyme
MPALSGLMLAALGLLAAVVVYFLAWRATSHRSIATQTLVRGGLFVLLAVPLAAVFLLSPTMHRATDRREPQLSSPLDETPPPPIAKSDARPDGRLGDPAGRASPPLATMAQETDWDVVPVFFGTDRQEKPDPKRLAFNAERGRRLELGRAMVTVPKSHQVPNIERPWVVKIPYFDVTIYEQAEDPAQHFTVQEIKKLSQADFASLARARLAASSRYKDHALIFVHGYNTAFDHAVYRTAQIAYDLKFDGAAFLYSWPSGGAVASYTYDRESAQASEPYMRAFLDLVIKQTGAKSVSIIAHSMGNQPLMDVLKDMRNAAPEVAINEVILAAPDVDADNFANVAQRIEGIARGVTLYAAANDRALIVSRNFWRNPRAGDVTASGPLIVPGIETIDVTAASTDSFALNHSGYAENNELLQDIGKLILEGLRPPDQRLPALKRTSSPKGDYWRYTAP